MHIWTRRSVPIVPQDFYVLNVCISFPVDTAIVASSLIDFLIPLIVQNIGVFDARVFRVLRVFRAIRALRALRVLRTIRYEISGMRYWV